MNSNTSRRTFVKFAGAAGAALTAGTWSSLARGGSANERIRVGVIGTGVRGKYLIGNLPQSARVTAICDCATTRMADTLQPQGEFKPILDDFRATDAEKCAMHQDYRRLIDNEKLDAVIIATPDHHHVPAAMLALQAGLDVYYNRIAGHQLGIDCWETTKPFYPRTVGADYWHNNEFGRLAKTRPLMQAMARNSGIENYQQIDLPQALREFEAGYRHVTNVTPVGRGQTYAIGESMDVTWRIDDADLFPYVNVYLEILGTTYKLKVGEHLVSATEHYRFQIPDTPLLADRGKSHPITSDKLRVRIAVDYGYEDHKQYGNASLSSGVFTIVAKRTTEPAPALLASVPTPLPDTRRMSGEMPWRIARWPGFYRGALAVVVNDDDPKLPGQLKVFAGREHPDLVSVVVDPRDAESKAERWRAMDSLGHEIVFKHGVLDHSDLERVFKSLNLNNTIRPITVGSDKTASLIVDNRPNEYRTLPETLDRLHSYHVKLGSEQAIRQAVDRVLTDRSLAILTFGSRGRDFEAQVNALHDRHGELWNGPFDRLVRYQVQARAAKLTVTARPSKFELHLKLTDDLPDNVYHEPLFLQIPVPHWQWRAAKCRQNGEERWAALITEPRNHNVLRFSAVPDAGPIVLSRK